MHIISPPLQLILMIYSRNLLNKRNEPKNDIGKNGLMIVIKLY